MIPTTFSVIREPPGVRECRGPSCGESYMTAETLKEIERIRLHWRQLSVDKKVPVAKFGGAA